MSFTAERWLAEQEIALLETLFQMPEGATPVQQPDKDDKGSDGGSKVPRVPVPAGKGPSSFAVPDPF